MAVHGGGLAKARTSWPGSAGGGEEKGEAAEEVGPAALLTTSQRRERGGKPQVGICPGIKYLLMALQLTLRKIRHHDLFPNQVHRTGDNGGQPRSRSSDRRWTTRLGTSWDAITWSPQEILSTEYCFTPSRGSLLKKLHV